jgi:type IV pilus assembly protein PilC
MAAFTYRAIDDQGRISSGELEALNGIDLELRLKRLGYDLITFEPVAGRSWLTSRRVSKPELINFCFHLEQMLTAGVPIIDALTDLRDSVDASEFKNVIAALLEDIEGGKTLSVAMANHPRAFDAVFVALVRAGG